MSIQGRKRGVEWEEDTSSQQIGRSVWLTKVSSPPSTWGERERHVKTADDDDEGHGGGEENEEEGAAAGGGYCERLLH